MSSFSVVLTVPVKSLIAESCLFSSVKKVTALSPLIVTTALPIVNCPSLSVATFALATETTAPLLMLSSETFSPLKTTLYLLSFATLMSIPLTLAALVSAITTPSVVSKPEITLAPLTAVILPSTNSTAAPPFVATPSRTSDSSAPLNAKLAFAPTVSVPLSMPSIPETLFTPSETLNVTSSSPAIVNFSVPKVNLPAVSVTTFSAPPTFEITTSLLALPIPLRIVASSLIA